MNSRLALERYAERGSRRGPDQVLNNAQNEAADPDYVDMAETSPRRISGSDLLLGGAVIVFVVCVMLIVGARRPTGTVESGSADVTAQDPRAEAMAHWNRVMTGNEWMRYSGSPGIPGVDVPKDAWVRFTPSVDHLREAYHRGIPVFDRPDGDVIGYDFANLGFVPRSIAEAPGFDAEAARAAKGACLTAPAPAECAQPSGSTTPAGP